MIKDSKEGGHGLFAKDEIEGEEVIIKRPLKYAL